MPILSNSVSMGRIDQSHAQKASGVTTSIHCVISPPGRGLCCILVFDPVLDICISEKHNAWNVFHKSGVRQAEIIKFTVNTSQLNL